MSLYPVSLYNIGTGYSSGTFTNIQTGEIDDTNGNTVITLAGGVATFPNTIIGSISSILAAVNSANIDYPVALLTSSSGAVSVYTGNLKYNPNTDTLTGAIFSGSSTTINTTTAPAGTFYITMVNAGTGGTAKVLYVDTGITYDPTTDTLATTNFSGLSSRSSTIDTTTAPAGTFYLTFVNSGTSGTSKIIYVDTGITYDPTSDTLTTTNFSGLSSRSSTIDTTTAPAGTFYLPLVNAGTGGSSKIVYVDTGISYNSSTDTLTATTFNGGANYINTNTMTGSIFYPIWVNTAAGSSNQIPWVTSSFNYTTSTSTLGVPNIECGVQLTVGGTQFISALSGRTIFSGGTGITVQSGIAVGTSYSSSSIVGISGILNAGATNFLQIYDSTITNILLSFNNTGLTTTLPITSRFTSNNTNATFYIPFVNSTATTVSSLLYVDTVGTPLSYNPSTGTLIATSFVGTVTGSASSIITTSSITNYSYTIPFVVGAGTETVYVETDGNQMLYNPAIATLTATNITVTNTLATTNVLNLYDTAVGSTTNYFSIYHNGGNLFFNNQWSPKPIPLTMDGNSPSISVYQVYSYPYDDGVTGIELDSMVVIDGVNSSGGLYNQVTNSDYQSFVTVTQPTSTSSGGLLTMSVKSCNPNGKVLTVSFPINTVFNATSSTLSQNQTVNLTATAVSMTKNGSSFTNFSYNDLVTTVSLVYTWGSGGPSNNPIQQPLYQMTVQFRPDDGDPHNYDTYVIKVTATMTKSGTGTIAFLNGLSGFALNYGTAHTPNPSPGFGFSTTDPTVTALSVFKNQINLTVKSILSDSYLQGQYINFVYTRTFTSTVSVVEPLTFPTGPYNTFDISWNFTSAPTAYTALTMGLASNTGTYLLSGYAGATAIMGSSYSSVAWVGTSGALICYIPATTTGVYTARISFPNNGRLKRITATNNGSASSSLANIPIVSTGIVNTTTSYNSMWWSVVGTAVNGTITVTGTNL
jgi:hypothetical protein